MPTAARILMCPPDHYGIEYEINPWMDRRQPADHQLATAQWHTLRDLLVAAGAEICLVPPQPGLPDMVFTANAALIYRQTAVLSAFRHPQRQGEQMHWQSALGGQGYRIELPPEGIVFEGAGDALFCGETLFAGYRIRSDAIGHQSIAAVLGIPVSPLELVDDYYYHLDTCFCPLSPEQAIYYPDAFDDYGRQVLRESIGELISVDEKEARRFACNAVVLGKTVVTNTGCATLHRALADRGFAPLETDLSEFVKAGGSAKCLTLRLDGEQASCWRVAD
jgi:N-dimethylarginine dimethylaminohydrolase